MVSNVVNSSAVTDKRVQLRCACGEMNSDVELRFANWLRLCVADSLLHEHLAVQCWLPPCCVWPETRYDVLWWPPNDSLVLKAAAVHISVVLKMFVINNNDITLKKWVCVFVFFFSPDIYICLILCRNAHLYARLEDFLIHHRCLDWGMSRVI